MMAFGEFNVCSFYVPVTTYSFAYARTHARMLLLCHASPAQMFSCPVNTYSVTHVRSHARMYVPTFSLSHILNHILSPFRSFTHSWALTRSLSRSFTYFHVYTWSLGPFMTRQKEVTWMCSGFCYHTVQTHSLQRTLGTAPLLVLKT